MLALLKNPQQAENLQPGKDWIYGAIGLVASILGFMIWVWMIGRKIDLMFGGLFGGFGGLTDLGDASGTIGSMLTGRLFVLAVISLVSLLGTLWLVGSWQGGRKLSVRELATYVGGANIRSRPASSLPAFWPSSICAFPSRHYPSCCCRRWS